MNGGLKKGPCGFWRSGKGGGGQVKSATRLFLSGPGPGAGKVAFHYKKKRGGNLYLGRGVGFKKAFRIGERCAVVGQGKPRSIGRGGDWGLKKEVLVQKGD